MNAARRNLVRRRADKRCLRKPSRKRSDWLARRCSIMQASTLLRNTLWSAFALDHSWRKHPRWPAAVARSLRIRGAPDRSRPLVEAAQGRIDHRSPPGATTPNVHHTRFRLLSENAPPSQLLPCHHGHKTVRSSRIHTAFLAASCLQYSGLGKVAKIGLAGIVLWTPHSRSETTERWPPAKQPERVFRF